MSGAAIIRELLTKNAAITAVVPATRIRAGFIPQATTLPAISVTTISESEEGTMARLLPIKMIRERVQVTVLAKDYVTMKKLMKATALGSGVHTGVVLGFNVNSVMPWGVNPEIPISGDEIYEQSRDFMVTFREAN